MKSFQKPTFFLKAALVLVLVFSVAVGLSAVEGDTGLFCSRVWRVEIQKPPGWFYEKNELFYQQQKSTHRSDRSFKKAVKDFSTIQVVMALKYAEPRPTFNPGLQVYLLANETPKLNACATMEKRLKVYSDNSPELEFLGPVEPCEVGGVPAARVFCKTKARNPSLNKMPLTMQIYAVPRDFCIYEFFFSGSPTGEDSLGPEVEWIMENVRFLE